METPYYQYDIDLLQNTLSIAQQKANRFGYTIHYAMKANANPKLLRIISETGFGADCVSGNEVRVALEHGFKPSGIVFAGVGKTDSEIAYAISQKISCLHCESVQELEVINSISGTLNRVTDVAIRINPNIDAHTHKNITTGLSYNKFGISLDDARYILTNLSRYPNTNLIGLHFHIGSQILNTDVFKRFAERVNAIQNELGTLSLPYLNLGGGLGINYSNPENHSIPDFSSYFESIHQVLKPGSGQSTHFELGRSLVGQCGKLISQVLFTKKSGPKRFAVVDAGMNALIRPALYGARHKIVNLSKRNQPIVESYNIVGPICETTDFLGEEIRLPLTERGDILAILSCGAYAESMASDYNLRGKPESLFIHPNAVAFKT